MEEIVEDPKKAAKLYRNLINDGYTKDNLGNENEFVVAIEDGVKAEKIYQTLISDGYSVDNLGSRDEFLSTFSKKKDLSGPGSKNGGQMSGTPSAPSQFTNPYNIDKREAIDGSFLNDKGELRETETPTRKTNIADQKSVGTTTSSPAQKSSGGLSWATKPQENTGFDLSQDEYTPPVELPALGNTVNTGSPNILNNAGFMQDIEANMNGTRTNNISRSLTSAVQAYDSAQGQGASQANMAAFDANNAQPLGALESMGNSFSNFANRLKGTIPRLNIVAADAWENALGKELTKKWYEFEGRDIDQVRSEAYAELEQLATQVKPTLGLVGAIENNDMKQFAAGLVNTITSLGSSVIPAIATGGAGIFTEMTGDALVDYNKEKAKRLGISVDELYRSGQADFQVPAMIGTASGAFELVGLKGVGNLFKNKVTGTAFKKGLFYFGQTQREGLTELLQGGLQAANKTIGAGGTPDDADKAFTEAVFSRDGLESYLQGVFGAAGAGAIGGVVSLARKPSAKMNISAAIQDIGLAEMNLSNPEISEQSRAVLTDQVNRRISDIANTVEQDEKATEELSESQKKKIDEIDAQIMQLESVIKDPNVTEEIKMGLRSEISALESQLNTINPEVEAGALDIPTIKQEAAANVNQAIEITDQLTDQLADATTIEEISEIKEVAVAAVKQGIEATQTLNQADRANLNLESKSSYKKGDAVSFVDEQGNNVSGLFKELTDDNKMVVGINEDGIYKEQTIPLPEVEPGKETKIEAPTQQAAVPAPPATEQVIEPTEYEGKSAEDLASMYNEEVNNPSISAKERAIAEMPFFLRRDSYVNFNDANNITSSKARSYFRKDGLGADQIAQEINNTKFDGNEVVTPQDIVDFVDTYPNGPQTINQPSGNPRLGSINEAYFNLTGKKLNRSIAEKIAVNARATYKESPISKIMAIDEELLTFIDNEGITIENINEIEDKLGWIFGNSDEASIVFNNIREFLRNGRNTRTAEEASITQQSSREADSTSGQGNGVEGSTRKSTATERNTEGVNGDIGINETQIQFSQDVNRTTQARKKTLVNERIAPEISSQPTTKSKKLNQILKDVVDGLDATLIYAKPEGRNAAGTYNPSNTLIKIKNAGNLDVAAHELAHLIDDRYNLLGNRPAGTQIRGRIKGSIDKELKWYSDRGGSNPPSHLDAAGKIEYLQREGFAEFIRAYIANPVEAKRVSPELFEYFEGTIDEKTKTELKKFSKDYIAFANTTAGEQVMANIESLESKKPGIKDWLMSFSKDKDNFHVSPFDRLNAQMVNSLAIANKAFEYILENKGVTDIVPEKNFELISRLFAGVNGKITRILESGLVDAKNEYMLSEDGKKMNLQWLLDKLDTTSEKTIRSEMDEVIRLLVAERTIEYAAKFKRTDELTGIGGGIKNDLEVAQQHILDFESLKSADSDKYSRIAESAARYREYADAGLRYAVEKGRLSQEKYDEIKEGNQYYVSLARVKEVAPTEEALEFINKFAKGGLTSVKDVFKSAKGGTGTIQNPYLSLIKNTTDIIRESDRNEVIRSFVEPLSNIRRMGDGTPVDFSSIARKVAPGEKNAKNIYFEGKKQTWQFQDDIYEALTGVDGIASNAFVDWMAKPGSLLRWTVTHSPFFAAKNVVRDTFARVVLSRTGSGIKELVHNLGDRELFDLYGGSQAGYFLIDKTAYAKQLKSTITEIAKSNNGLVLDPRNIAKGWNWYEKTLSKGENVNRIAEFKSAFKKAKLEGLDDYNAGLQAAFEARDLMDFSLAGHAMKVINRIIPFSNAGIQGLRRSALAIKENPAGFAVRIAMYTVLPQLAIRALIHAMGDDDEYEQLPAHYRDLAYTFRTPFTGDKWISIPKPFDLGLPSAYIDRMISMVMGNDHAFGGFTKSMLSVLIPFDEGSIMGPFRPIVESLMNKDTFRDAPIIPNWEEKRLLKNREGTKYASYLGKSLSNAMGLVGAETDPRYIDHFIKSQFTYYGDWTMSLSNLISGDKDARNKVTVSKTGFVKETPIANAQAVKDVYKLATELGVEKSAAVKGLSSQIKVYYSLDDEQQRRKMADHIYARAIELRTAYEKLKAKKKK